MTLKEINRTVAANNKLNKSIVKDKFNCEWLDNSDNE